MNSRAGRRRRAVLGVLAAVLVVVGLVLATTAPAGPSTNNKVDAYGGPMPQKPTNPKNRAACDSYYSAANKLAEAQGCRAKAAYNVAKKACAKKSGAKKAACLKAAKRKFTRCQGQGRQAGEGREGLPGRVHEGLQRHRGADRRTRFQRPGLRRAAGGAAGQETAAGTTQQACLKKAQRG